MRRRGGYIQGTFRPKNPAKYRGNLNNITFRSSWELRLFNYLDQNSSVLEWNSEEVVIPYFFPLDGKWHRYFVDAYAKFRTRSGEIQKYLIEVKPEKETLNPALKPRKRRTKYSRLEEETYAKNSCKWKAATEAAELNGMKFIILTENELYNKKRHK
jgi:hypothetical protein